MPNIKIDGKEFEVEDGTLAIQACEQAGVEIPRFCYHERLAVAGNCRMCLVEIKPGPPKPQASCAITCTEGMEITTDSPMVKKAREGVMEFLLINHPLDCPICDQAGECDLQDQSIYFGSGKSRYDENKRAVPEKDMGPLIKTHMTRCIHCTRCVRFCDDVAGVSEMGAVNRGENMEITTYLEKSLTSELSANVVDLCPVGALTSRPYAFNARPWELKKTESIDVLDAVGSNIRVDSKGNEVMRILPRNHDDVNEEWISDKSRYACDGLKYQRLDKPYVKVDGKLKPATWDDALGAVAKKLRATADYKVAVIAGDQVDAETMFAAKELFDSIGIKNQTCLQDGAKIDAKNRSSYLANSGIAGIEEADKILLIGANPRHEAPLVNLRIRKAFLNGAKVVSIGEELDLNYDYEQLGNDPALIAKADKFLKGAEKAVVIVGSGVLLRDDALAVQAAAQKLAEKTGAEYNVLHTAASRVAGLDIGFVPKAEFSLDDMEVIYLIDADEIAQKKLDGKFVIYQGHHGDVGAHMADVILPGAAYTEKSGTYLNLEGRAQQTQKAVSAPGEAMEDWKIINELSKALSKSLRLKTLDDLREKMFKKLPHFAKLDEIKSAKLKVSETKEKLSKEKFANPIKNFYMTCAISRHSKTMAQCVDEILGGKLGAKEAA